MQAPRILSEVHLILREHHLIAEVDEFLKTRQPKSFLITLKQRLLLAPSEVQPGSPPYNAPLINSLVLYVGMQVLLFPLHSTTSALSSPLLIVRDHSNHLSYVTPPTTCPRRGLSS